MGTVGGGGGSTNRVEMCVALRGRPFSSQGCMHIVLLLPQQNHTRLAFRQCVGIASIDSHACDARLVLQKIFLPNTNQSSYKMRVLCLSQTVQLVMSRRSSRSRRVLLAIFSAMPRFCDHVTFRSFTCKKLECRRGSKVGNSWR